MEIGIILASVGAFFGGAVSIYALLAISAVIRKKRSERKKVNMRSRRSEASEAEKTAGKDKPRIGKMDLILVIMGVTSLLFTLKMIQLFEMYQTVPDTLITMVFGFCGGECGVMGWIKTTKERQTDRRWQIEDEKRTEEATNLAETSEWNDP